MIEPCRLAALAGIGRVELEPQSLMGTAEVVPRAPPRQVGLQSRGELGGCARAAGQGGEALPKRHVEAFDEGSVDGTGEAELLKCALQVFALAELHASLDMGELAAALGFDDLAAKQVERHLPFRFSRGGVREPVAEVGGESLEVEVEAITGTDRHTARGERERDGMDERVGEVLGAGAELAGGDELGFGIKGDPAPGIVRFVAERGVELSKLEMANLPVAKEVGVNLFGLGASTGEPKA